ncbi:MAG: YbgC/FadM family acyl-CoA thioesterase [Alphaproteobacteria bacterium]
MHHNLPCRVYYENTDAGGIVYHAQYLHFAERGRTEFLRHIGHQSSELKKTHNLMFVARHLDIQYYAPAFLDDVVTVRTSVAEIKNSSFKMRQLFIRTHAAQSDQASETPQNNAQENTGENTEEKIAEMMVTLVCVRANDIKPLRVPDDLRRKFVEFTE